MPKNIGKVRALGDALEGINGMIPVSSRVVLLVKPWKRIDQASCYTSTRRILSSSPRRQDACTFPSILRSNGNGDESPIVD